MATFDDALQEIRRGIVDVAKKEAAQFVSAVVKDGDAFLDATRRDLERWTGLLARREITAADFASLVRGRRDLAEMTALKQAGLTAIMIDRIREAVIDLVITAAGKMV